MSNVISFIDFCNNAQAVQKAARTERLIASIRRGERIALARDIEAFKRQAALYIEVGNESDHPADKFVANGMANEELRKAADLQQQLDAM